MRATLAGLDAAWRVNPAEARVASTLRPRASGSGGSRSPSRRRSRRARSTPARGSRYEFERVEVAVEAPLTVEVVSAHHGRGRAGDAVAGAAGADRHGHHDAAQRRAAPRRAARLRIGVPSGWTAPAAQPVTIPAGGELDVTTTVAVPRNADQSVQDVTLTSTFTGAGERSSPPAPRRCGSRSARCRAGPYDRVDLGNGASEQAHGLTAAPSSGTSTEAGLTRRYAGHLTPFSWFEFDATVVPKARAFVLRVIETYDRAQTKRYKVYVDGQEVLLRTFSRGSGGTETYEFVVPAARATDDRVRIRFENQDDPAFYDPSIADVWTLPLEAS